MINIKQKPLILSFFFLLSGCISVSDIMEKDETGAEPIDEVGQLLSDIQEEENSTLPEINDEPALELSDEKLDPTPTQLVKIKLIKINFNINNLFFIFKLQTVVVYLFFRNITTLTYNICNFFSRKFVYHLFYYILI